MSALPADRKIQARRFTRNLSGIATAVAAVLTAFGSRLVASAQAPRAGQGTARAGVMVIGFLLPAGLFMLIAAVTAAAGDGGGCQGDGEQQSRPWSRRRVPPVSRPARRRDPVGAHRGPDAPAFEEPQVRVPGGARRCWCCWS